MSKKSSKTLNRREYLAGSAAIAASVALPGCGGGDESLNLAEGSAPAEDATSKSGLVTGFPTPVIPTMSKAAREVYFVEVAVRSSGSVNRITLIEPLKPRFPGDALLSREVLISSRSTVPIGMSGSVLSFATIDTSLTSTGGLLYSEIWQKLAIKFDYAPLVGVTRSFIVSGTTPRPANADYNFFTDSGWDEHEWIFSRPDTVVTSSNWVAAVRFFKARPEEYGNSRQRLVTETTAHDAALTEQLAVILAPSSMGHVPWTESLTDVVTSVGDPNSGIETLKIPDYRYPGHIDLLRPGLQNHRSNESQAHTIRKIHRHIVRFARRIKSVTPINLDNKALHIQRGHQELVRCLLGPEVAKKLGNYHSKVVNRAKNEPNYQYFKNPSQLESMLLATRLDIGYEVDPSVEDYLQSNLTIGKNLSRQFNTPSDDTDYVRRGVVSTYSYQGKILGEINRAFFVITEETDGLFGTVEAGLKVSGVGDQISVRSNRVGSTQYSYSAANDGRKTSIVVNYTAGNLTFFTNSSLELELTMPLTIKDGLVRVDAVAIDILTDYDLRKKTGNIFEDFVGELLNDAAKGLLKLFGGITTMVPVPNFAANRVHDLAIELANRAAQALPGNIITEPVAAEVANEARSIAGSVTPRTWQIVELSPLRFGFYNTDLATNYTGDFKPGWGGEMTVINTPGVKLLGATGLTVFKVTSGTYTFNSWLRIQGGVDFHHFYGDPKMFDAVQINTY